MEPTLHEGDHVYTTMLPYLFGEPKIGDIVIVDISLTGKPSYFHMFGQVLRRNAITSLILGVAGDELRFEDGKFYRNGTLVEEDYINDQNVLTYPVDTTIVVPDGYVYVMGDNRNASKDSRHASVGPIPLYKIVGKMWKSA